MYVSFEELQKLNVSTSYVHFVQMLIKKKDVMQQSVLKNACCFINGYFSMKTLNCTPINVTLKI